MTSYQSVGTRYLFAVNQRVTGAELGEHGAKVVLHDVSLLTCRSCSTTSGSTVPAMQLDTNPNAIHMNLFDARRNLRAGMAATEHPPIDVDAA